MFTKTGFLADNGRQGVEEVDDILIKLTTIRAEMVAAAAMSKFRLDYLRPLQLRLALLGLSSLGRAESHVLATVDAALAAFGEA